MAKPSRTHLSDLRGATRMAFDATMGITRIVESMHRTIQLAPGPLGKKPGDRPAGITGLVYRSILGSVRLIGKGVDIGLAPVEGLLPEGEPSPVRDAFVSALNGIYGDYLARTENPLAMEMSLRHQGRQVDPGDPTEALAACGETLSSGRLLVLVHGLCLNDRHWLRKGHDHGAALAADLGYVPLYLRYNSGLHIEANGAALAGMLETLVNNWRFPLRELVIVGHSMGGLVARSACHYAGKAGHAWRRRLSKLVFLGTPHHGAPLERSGHRLDHVLQFSPYSAPFTRIGKARSAGITDLRHGSITRSGPQHVPLPRGVKSYAVAATLGERRSALGERLLGDGLVPLDSALGRHSDAARTLKIPRQRQWIAYRMGHMELLERPEVYVQLRAWLQ